MFPKQTDCYVASYIIKLEGGKMEEREFVVCLIRVCLYTIKNFLTSEHIFCRFLMRVMMLLSDVLYQ